mgnify:CR=1 FL=1
MMVALGVCLPGHDGHIIDHHGSLGYMASMFHLFTHAMFKACLFLGAGCIIHAVHSNEMSAMGGGMNFYGEMPAMYNITVNMENPIIARIMEAKAADVAPSEDQKVHKADLEAFAEDNDIIKQITDLALLANGMLKGKDLSDFIARSAKVVENAYLK